MWTTMTDPVADTLAYYDQRAADFAGQTAGLDLGPLYDRFLRYVRPGGLILDADCGPGRDALAFTERGYKVFGTSRRKSAVALNVLTVSP